MHDVHLIMMISKQEYNEFIYNLSSGQVGGNSVHIHCPLHRTGYVCHYTLFSHYYYI